MRTGRTVSLSVPCGPASSGCPFPHPSPRSPHIFLVFFLRPLLSSGLVLCCAWGQLQAATGKATRCSADACCELLGKDGCSCSAGRQTPGTSWREIAMSFTRRLAPGQSDHLVQGNFRGRTIRWASGGCKDFALSPAQEDSWPSRQRWAAGTMNIHDVTLLSQRVL